MPLKLLKKEIEAEREIGHRYLQVLSRAEALVPGAGREAIEPLLWDAGVAIIRADVQNDRVVLDGALSCQAVYRQGEETTLRALSAKSTVSQVADIPGAQPGMLSRVQAVMEHVEAKYENGHMVFLVSLGLHVWVLKLERMEVIEGLEEESGVETKYREWKLVKLAAEANETAVLTERVELPRALDARATLMDWGSVQIDSCEPDLGGVRVKGRAVIETLVGSGIEGKPGVVVKYPIEFDKLIELPEWLCKDVSVLASIRNIRTQLESGDEEEDGTLLLQADVYFEIAANLREQAKVLEDAYSIAATELKLQTDAVGLCTDVRCTRSTEMVRGTAPLGEGAPAVGSVIAVRAIPNIAELRSAGGKGQISGLIEATVLYMPVGSDRPISSAAELPFTLDVPLHLDEDCAIRIAVTGAEANALMSDRLEMKISLDLCCEQRRSEEMACVTDIEEGESAPRRPGYIICWPEPDEDAWAIARRYKVPLEQVRASTGEGGTTSGEPLVLRI